ncbi:tetratricopeptide repeat protein [Desulfovibrio sp. OttesenSCG-928-A18]|nr:tetratricopeptide repeat protein [Desulfovibrio sp. OttesenSCG-928-A18]
MDSGSFLGLFSVRDKTSIAALPFRNESGLWQAWAMADGGYMIQALDSSHAPWGGMYVISPESFNALLVSVKADPAGFFTQESMRLASRQKKRLRSDSPELFSMWLLQSEEPRNHASGGQDTELDIVGLDMPYPGSFGFADSIDPDMSSQPARAPVAQDEAVFMPVWHPDKLLPDDNQPEDDEDVFLPQHPTRHTPHAPGPGRERPDSEMAYAHGTGGQDAHAREQENFHPAAGSAQNAFARDGSDLSSLLSTQGAAASSPAAQSAAAPYPGAQGAAATPQSALTDDEAEEARREEQAARLESSMRDAFARILEQMDQGRPVELEQEISRLIMRGSGFTWKQKFMFTEFGLALRRKRLPKLALACHMRALGFAPRDEHILFNVARTEYELGNVDAAKEYLRRALEATPDFSIASNFLNFLNGQN